MQSMAEGAGGTALLDQNQEMFGCTSTGAHQKIDTVEGGNEVCLIVQLYVCTVSEYIN